MKGWQTPAQPRGPFLGSRILQAPVLLLVVTAHAHIEPRAGESPRSNARSAFLGLILFVFVFSHAPNPRIPESQLRGLRPPPQVQMQRTTRGAEVCPSPHAPSPPLRIPMCVWRGHTRRQDQGCSYEGRRINGEGALQGRGVTDKGRRITGE